MMTKFTPDSPQVLRCRELRKAGHSLINISHEVGVTSAQVHYFCNEKRFGPRVYPSGPLLNADGSQRERASMHKMMTYHGVSFMRRHDSPARIRMVTSSPVPGGTLCIVRYFIPDDPKAATDIPSPAA